MEELTTTMVLSNISSSPGHLSHASLDSNGLVPALVLSLCLLVGIPGNIAVIILRPNWGHLSGLSQSLMLNLTVSDLLCLLTLPLWIYVLLYGWTFGLVACKFLVFLVYCSVYGSQLTVTGLSVQRYLLVVHQHRRLHQVRIRMLLVLLWLLAMLLSIPALVVRQLTTDQQLTRCQPRYSSEVQNVAVLLTETLVGFVSLSLVIFSYIQLHKKVNQTAFFNNPQTTRLVTSIIVTFFVLWVPYHITNLLGVAAISLKNKELLKFCTASWNIVGSLTFVNSCLNPLLYAFTSHNICNICQKTQPLRPNVEIPQTQDISAASEP
ncbi:C-C chemokine receptor type 7-like [Melanotaenia boesemani]|uniref:C-C chemokine receptor type 7-like n=1 Tax=Melanotaenia boesemani TaxID=1250792 RepID=UPI001C05A264|nr:C-C chemokine receptor type 7-like [Melanotaenia boesemani]